MGSLFFRALILVGLLACTAQAGHPCGQRLVANKYYAAQYVAPVVVYQAGRDLELEALAEKLAKIMDLREQQRAAQQQAAAPQPRAPWKQRAEQASEPAAAHPGPQPGVLGLGDGVMVQHCASCHSGATPAKGLTYDGVTAVTARQVTQALRSVEANRMPKDHKLEPADKARLMVELFQLEEQPEQAAE